jgi:hypothetical protein
MPILESDWKKLKELREIALDRSARVSWPTPKPSAKMARYRLTPGIECFIA